MPEPKYGWVPATYTQKERTTLYYRGADESVLRLPQTAEKDVLPLDRFLLMQTTHDLMSIYEGRCEPYVLYVLASRYYKGKLYTKVADRVLLSMNPYRLLPLYTDDVIEKYIHGDPQTLPPHVFQVAKSALQPLVRERKSQSIVIIGESGSGKTEACKQIIKVRRSRRCSSWGVRARADMRGSSSS